LPPLFGSAPRWQWLSQTVTDAAKIRARLPDRRRGRFTDKGTPEVIPGRKAKVFAILDFGLPVLD
jgi:hypothetical protein